jgi:hypothetical protein
MGFSVFVEAINLRIRPKAAPVHLHEPYVAVPESKNTQASPDSRGATK